MKGRQSTRRVMANFCPDIRPASGISPIVTSRVWALLSVQPASASGNTIMEMAGALVTSRSTALLSVHNVSTAHVEHQ